jgi:hypothetical protein
MSNAPFPIQAELTAVAIAYRNRKLIADQVLPRAQVGKQEFKYLKHTLADGFTVPDTKVGRKGRPNEVDFSASEVTDSTVDYGLDDPVPQADIDNAPPNYNPLGRATEGLTDLILLDREKRAADLVFAAATYPSANKTALTGTDQWSDYANSDPVEDISVALDVPVMRPTIGIVGQAVWSSLKRHPKILKAIYGSLMDAGIATRKAVADLFELEEILVGEAWLNGAKKGQTVSLGRVWGKHASFIYRDSLASADRGTTFGLTAQFGGRIAGATADSNIGLRGGQRVRVGESVKEVISASDLGYFIADAVA